MQQSKLYRQSFVVTQMPLDQIADILYIGVSKYRDPETDKQHIAIIIHTAHNVDYTITLTDNQAYNLIDDLQAYYYSEDK